MRDEWITGFSLIVDPNQVFTRLKVLNNLSVVVGGRQIKISDVIVFKNRQCCNESST